MPDFELIIDDKTYQGQLLTYGFSYKIMVFIDDIPVSFEPDEERNFRALVPQGSLNKVSTGLLKRIAEELKKNLE